MQKNSQSWLCNLSFRTLFSRIRIFPDQIRNFGRYGSRSGLGKKSLILIRFAEKNQIRSTGYISISLPLQPFSVLYFHLSSSQKILCVIFPTLYLSYHSPSYISISLPLLPISVLYFHFFLSNHSVLYFHLSFSQIIFCIIFSSLSLSLLPFSLSYFHLPSSPTILYVIFPSPFLSNHTLCYIFISFPLQPFSMLYFHLSSSPTTLWVIFSFLFYLPFLEVYFYLLAIDQDLLCGWLIRQLPSVG